MPLRSERSLEMLSPADLISPAALTRYDSSGEPEYTPSERILLALRWFDWASSSRIFEALDLEDIPRELRKTYAKALSRLVESGRVEVRGQVILYEYRLARKQPAPTQRGMTRDERIHAGTCLRCSRDAAPDRLQCQAHLDAQAVRNRRRSAPAPNSQRT
jgi:hypothetical protein